MKILKKCNYCDKYPIINSLYDVTCAHNYFLHECQRNRVITPLLSGKFNNSLCLKSITEWNNNVIKNTKSMQDITKYME